MFEALGEPVRRRILELLAAGEQPAGTVVAAMQAETRISQPAVSQHLKVLKEAGLVRDEAAGTRRIYAVDPDGIDMLRTYLDRFWNRSLAAFKAAAESEEHR